MFNVISWYYNPPIVHNILVHGSSVAKFALLPIDQLSEEAARNNDLNSFRLNHTRTFSRSISNRNLFNDFYQQSDPVICSKHSYKFKETNLPEQMKNVII